MTVSAHIYVAQKMAWRGRLAECPRVGDTLRYGTMAALAKVTEVIWCLDELPDGETSLHRCVRVNIRAEHIG